MVRLRKEKDILRDSLFRERIKMTKKKKVVLGTSIAGGSLLVAILLGLVLTGYFVGWGPFRPLANIRFGKMEGNQEKYDVSKVEPLEESPLEGMNICYLGSSVTYGASSLGTSFVEYIAKRNKTTFVKEAISGTTLSVSSSNGSSYIERMEKLHKDEKFDMFVCQLSTNDASRNVALGSVSDVDPKTVCGAINHIIDYAKKTWQCPMVFYTNAYYESASYAAMVASLKEIAERKDVGVIDLYTDKTFNDISSKERKLYMADKIHPTKAGYLKWWTPKMEEHMYEMIGERK